MKLYNSSLKGTVPHFSSEDKESVRISLKLRDYNNSSHHIAFEMDRNMDEKKLYVNTSHGVFAKSRNGKCNGTKD
jgi:hypothetical protein